MNDNVGHTQNDEEPNPPEREPAAHFTPAFSTCFSRASEEALALLVVAITRTTKWTEISFRHVALNAALAINEHASILVEARVHFSRGCNGLRVEWIPRVFVQREIAIAAQCTERWALQAVVCTCYFGVVA